jgi:5-methylcytosine-specific restriction endonuclease McrA
MIRAKQFGNTLHNVSKKRLAEIEAGTWKPKPRKPLRKASKKSASLWSQARKECFDRFGHKCFLCGATGEIHVHHWQFTRQQRPDLKYDKNNLICLCGHCHNHTGADKRFYELKDLIQRKLNQN